MRYSKFMANIAVSETMPDHLKHSLEIPRYEFIALCMSELCSHNDYGVIKDVDRKESFCPQCGHALFWTRHLV